MSMTVEPAVRHAPAMHIRPYRAADLEALILQPAQAHLQPLLLGHGYAQALEACEAWTFAVRESPIETEKIIACMGVHRLHPARALAWSLIAGDAGRHFQAIHRAARRYLRVTPYTRIEAHVEDGFTAGARWLTLLGFECETPQGMRAFTPEGRTCRLYAYVSPLAAAAPPRAATHSATHHATPPPQRRAPQPCASQHQPPSLHDAAPNNATPNNATPNNAAPNNAAPNNATPNNAAPAPRGPLTPLSPQGTP